MPIIGTNTIGTSSDTGAGSDVWLVEAQTWAAARYTAASGDTVTKVWYYSAHNGGGASSTVRVGVYVYSGGVPTTLVNSAQISITGSAGWYSTTVSWALTGGVEYVVAQDYNDASISVSQPSVYWTDQASTAMVADGTSAQSLPGTWTGGGTTSVSLVSAYAEVTSSGTDAPAGAGAATGTGNASTPAVAAYPGATYGTPTGLLLLEDGTSHLLLEDGTSRLTDENVSTGGTADAAVAAYDATVSTTSSGTSAPAGAGTVTSTANAAAVSVAAAAGLGTATAAGQAPTASIKPNAAAGTAAAAANGAAPSVAVQAGLATVTATGYDAPPPGSTSAPAGLATVSVAANDGRVVRTPIHDDFSGSAIDATQWDVYDRLGDQVNSEVNAVIPANVRVSSGTLKIDQKYETVTAGDTTTGAPNPRSVDYTSGQIAQAGAPFLYGTVTVRAKVPNAAGTWPCIWMLGYEWQASQPYTANVAGADWPNGGWWEIDIAEFLGGHRTQVNNALHFITANRTGSGEKSLTFNATAQFAVYRLVWTATSLTWFVDAEDGNGFVQTTQITGTAGVDIPDTPGYLIIHTAIGGPGGTPVSTDYPDVMEVDYAYVTFGGDAPVAPATVAALDAKASVKPTAGTGTATATAYGATVAGSSNTNASAGAGSVAASALDASVSTEPNAGTAAASAAAGAPSSAIAATAGTGAATAAALDAKVSAAPNAGTGTATAAANDATVTGSSSTNASAGAGSAAASAYGAIISIAPGAAAASASVSALAPAVALAAAGGLATVAVAGQSPTVTTVPLVNAPAGAGSAAVGAYGATVSVKVAGGQAVVTALAYDVVASTGAATITGRLFTTAADVERWTSAVDSDRTTSAADAARYTTEATA